MTAPDRGLTDLLAAHSVFSFTERGGRNCNCGWTGLEHPAHVALVVEQHTQGQTARIAELAAENVRLTHGIQQISMERDGYQQAYENDNAATFGITGLIQRANVAEATVARVEAALPNIAPTNPRTSEYYKGWDEGQRVVVKIISAALEGGQR